MSHTRLGQRSYTWERIYGMLPLKAREAAFWDAERQEEDHYGQSALMRSLVDFLAAGNLLLVHHRNWSNNMSQAMPYHSRPVVALLTDFGLHDSYVGVMKGVIATIATDRQIIDITHDVAPQHIASGAWILATSYRYFPEQTIFVCVVDPGVGSSRRAVAIHAGNWFFVGPDNGLFSYVLAEQPVHAAVVLSNSLYHLTQVSATFHGRDIFAPTGAHLARGVALSEMGARLDPLSLQRIDITPPVRHKTHIDAHIVHVDHFGNLISNIPLSLIPELFDSSPEEQRVRIIFPTLGTVVEQRSRFFAEAPDDGQPFMFQDSSGYVGIAIRNGNAARAIGAELGTPITYTTASVAGQVEQAMQNPGAES